MFFHVRSLDEHAQGRLALWAPKMAILLDATGSNTVPHGAGQGLEIFGQPHHGMRVWIAAYRDVNPLTWVSRPIYIPGDDSSNDFLGLCITFSVVKVAFQVLIPFYEGDLARRPIPCSTGHRDTGSTPPPSRRSPRESTTTART
ncbi:hypothetical protein [Streptomyces sp. NPDC058683]|uniref:hypothetical protein n=1 Tax=Streptomyces sp. NPDC058683 TaxID=3346597 RepID=UPI003654CB9F